MLIPSERHTAADLELWRDLEEGDRSWGERPRLVEQSLAAIVSFQRPDYASVSWGKDSVCLAHLIYRSGLGVPLVHLRPQRVANPLSHLVRDEVLKRFPLPYREVEIDYGSADEKAGDAMFFAAFRACGSRYLSGVRADESRGRLERVKRWGLTSKNCCAPLGRWKSRDVFGYLAAHDLPVHPNYAMLGGGRWPREHLRVDELCGERGCGMGRTAWEREYWGDVLNRLALGASA